MHDVAGLSLTVVGADFGSQVNSDVLRQIAVPTGAYEEATSSAALAAVFDRLARRYGCRAGG